MSEKIDNLLESYCIMRDRVAELEQQVEAARREGFEDGWKRRDNSVVMGISQTALLKRDLDDYAKSREGK